MEHFVIKLPPLVSPSLHTHGRESALSMGVQFIKVSLGTVLPALAHENEYGPNSFTNIELVLL